MTKNINKIPIQSKKELALNDYFIGVKEGNRTILSKAITLIESANIEHQQLAEDLIDLCLPFSGNSIRIGITGVPGVGKSTFIEALGSYIINQKNKKVAVLAIDPSSTKTGGSILGDKTRMNKLAINENAFIRPSPSSGALGGVAKATRETVILCEAAGYDTIMIETVGVGQSEIEVKSMVDFFLLLMLAGAGDELQGIKRGIMEIADAIIINKADGNNIDKANIATQEYNNAIHLFPANDNGWIPKVNSCSSTEDIGIEVIWEIIESYFELTKSNETFYTNRKLQSKFLLEHTINASIKELFYTHKQVKVKLDELENLVMEGKLSPFKDAQEIIKLNPEHISLYNLEIDKKLPISNCKLPIPDNDTEADMFEYAIKSFNNAGLKHYEISNFAKPGKECQHNIAYWLNKNYLGIGTGAHSHVDGKRWDHNGPIECNEKQETIFMGLRLLDGISKDKFKGFEKEVEELKQQKLLEETTENIKLTNKGLILVNLVFKKFV